MGDPWLHIPRYLLKLEWDLVGISTAVIRHRFRPTSATTSSCWKWGVFSRPVDITGPKRRMSEIQGWPRGDTVTVYS